MWVYWMLGITCVCVYWLYSFALQKRPKLVFILEKEQASGNHLLYSSTARKVQLAINIFLNVYRYHTCATLNNIRARREGLF